MGVATNKGRRVVKKRTPKSDPRFVWLFVIGAFALLLFACVLIVLNQPTQLDFVKPVFGMSAMLLAAGGFIKFDVTSLFSK